MRGLERTRSDIADGWLTVRQAAAYLGVSEKTVYRHRVALRACATTDSPRAPLRFKRADLDAYMRSKSLGPAP